MVPKAGRVEPQTATDEPSVGSNPNRTLSRPPRFSPAAPDGLPATRFSERRFLLPSTG
jgi:hypothetical protein